MKRNRTDDSQIVDVLDHQRLDMAKQLCSDTIFSVDVKSKLWEISNYIWKNPELGPEEHLAHTALTDFLENEGFTVVRSYIMPTAFKASYTNPSLFSNIPILNVGVMCEYDALPEIGHACGHNLIAEAGLAAGLAVKSVLEKDSTIPIQLTIFGTPHEEGGGGKVIMINGNAFKDIDVALMVHPTPYNTLNPKCLSVEHLEIEFTGKASHASAFPWLGINALDAAISAYTSISHLRQQCKPQWRVHGIITKGGTKPNIIPEHTEMSYLIRAPNDEEVKLLLSKVKICCEGAALTTGCKVNFTMPNPAYSNLNTNRILAELYRENSSKIGIEYPPYSEEFDLGSTDMGNVSYAVPSIHPCYAITTPDVAVNHNIGFTKIANTDLAHDMTLKSGLTMAHTILDLAFRPGCIDKIKEEFINSSH